MGTPPRTLASRENSGLGERPGREHPFQQNHVTKNVLSEQIGHAVAGQGHRRYATRAPRIEDHGVNGLSQGAEQRANGGKVCEVNNHDLEDRPLCLRFQLALDCQR